MKNIKYNFLLIATFSVVITGCIRKFDVVLPQGTTQLVVNTHLTNDDIMPYDSTQQTYNSTLPNVQISLSTDPLEPTSTVINDPSALIQITENGTTVATAVYSPYNGSYNARYTLGNFKPQPNKTYTLRVKTAGFTEVVATASTTSAMQNFRVVRTVDSTSTGGGPNGGGGGGPNGGRRNVDKLTITLQDDPNTADFYEIKTFNGFINDNGTGVLDTFLRQNQLISNSPDVETDYNSGNALLSDNTFNGQNFSFYVNNSQFDNQQYSIYYVRMYKITKERYLYLKSVRRQQQSGNGSNPFAEPSFVYSNMPNGFGIFSFGLGRTVQAELR